MTLHGDDVLAWSLYLDKDGDWFWEVRYRGDRRSGASAFRRFAERQMAKAGRQLIRLHLEMSAVASLAGLTTYGGWETKDQ